MIERLLATDRVVVIAHRGGARLRPENTIAAFDLAASLNVDGLECDVHLSADGEPMVIHDPTLDRTTDASGPVSNLTADALSRVDAGFHFDPDHGWPYRGAGHGVPRLEHLLRRFPEMPVVIEIKGDAPETAMRVLDVVHAVGASARVIIGGFSHGVLSAVRRAAPGLPTSASREELQGAVRRSRVWLAPRRTGFAVLQAPFRFRGQQIFGRSFVRAARRAGLPVHAWIVDDPGEMRMLLDWGVTGIISDRPDLAVEVRDAADDH